MDTIVKTGNDAAVAASRNDFDSSKDKLLSDLKILAADAEQLIKETIASPVEGIAALRARLEGKLADARTKFDSTRTAYSAKACQAADATHAYVKDNPWQAAGASALAGAIIGFLLGRR